MVLQNIQQNKCLSSENFILAIFNLSTAQKNPERCLKFTVKEKCVEVHLHFSQGRLINKKTSQRKTILKIRLHSNMSATLIFCLQRAKETNNSVIRTKQSIDVAAKKTFVSSVKYASLFDT